MLGLVFKTSVRYFVARWVRPPLASANHRRYRQYASAFSTSLTYPISCPAVRLLSLLLLLLTFQHSWAGPITITEIAAGLHIDGVNSSQFSSASAEYTSSLDADNYGSYNFSFTNTSAAQFNSAGMTSPLYDVVAANVGGR